MLFSRKYKFELYGVRLDFIGSGRACGYAYGYANGWGSQANWGFGGDYDKGFGFGNSDGCGTDECTGKG